jgi:SAM-dependent methyltransferase
MTQMPVFCNVLWDDRNAAVSCDRGDIVLAYCQECSFMFNTVYEAELLRYSQQYDNCLHFSGHFHRYAESLADRLIGRYDLRDKLVIDVGCGKGDFLKLLCERGPNRGVGYDPSFEARGDIEALGENVTVVNDYYSDKYSGHGGDFLCCRHVLEHVEHPADLLAGVLGGLGGRSGVPVFFEVPNAAYTIQHVFVWDVIYEHPCYFTGASLKKLFAASGFDVSSVDEEFDGQYLGLHAITGGDGGSGNGEGRTGLEELIGGFTRAFDSVVERWQTELEKIAGEQRTAVVWGAGSKGVTFLNLLDREGRIAHAVDVSPNKQGKFVAGSGQEVVAPESLTRLVPDDILVMNPVYEREVRSQLQAMGLTARVRSL